MFLEKTKLKDDSSNDAKNYVLDALLGDRPVAGADADVMNVCQA